MKEGGEFGEGIIKDWDTTQLSNFDRCELRLLSLFMVDMWA